jgi:hypothetical protein
MTNTCVNELMRVFQRPTRNIATGKLASKMINIGPHHVSTSAIHSIFKRKFDHFKEKTRVQVVTISVHE